MLHTTCALAVLARPAPHPPACPPTQCTPLPRSLPLRPPSSGQTFRLTAPLAALAAAVHLVRGEGLPGVFGAAEAAAYVGTAAAAATEVLKFSGGMQGGETGTGGRF